MGAYIAHTLNSYIGHILHKYMIGAMNISYFHTEHSVNRLEKRVPRARGSRSGRLVQTADTARKPLHHSFMYIVVNFDALAQASDFPIERGQVVFLC